MLGLFFIIYAICDIIGLSKRHNTPTTYKQSESPPTDEQIALSSANSYPSLYPSTGIWKGTSPKKYVKKYSSNVFDDLEG